MMYDFRKIPNSYSKYNYRLLFDPLDGPSNIDVNISIGTIFSVLRCPEGIDELETKHFLQPGSEQVAAGYTVYGPSTMLVLTVGSGVHAFTLDRELGSFLLTSRDLKIPEDTKRSEEQTSELQSLMRISYAVFCLKKKTTNNKYTESDE